jgi:pimeloyl-ACP methyl ester carboxylesterase
MASKLPRAESVTLMGLTHIVNIEDAEAFNAAVLRFLEKIRAEAA